MKRFLALVLILTACSPDATPPGSAVEEIEGAAPVLEGTSLGGGVLGPSDYRGRVMVVNLWATWCGPCEREQPILAAAARAQGADGAYFLGIDERDDPDAALAWLDRYDVPYPSLPDPSGYLAYRFWAPYLPVTIVIDAAGRLRYRVVGGIDRETLDRLIQRAGSS